MVLIDWNYIHMSYRYASVMAIESPSKEDDEQWLAYWILYSFLTLTEIVLEPVLEWYVSFTFTLPIYFYYCVSLSLFSLFISETSTVQSNINFL